MSHLEAVNLLTRRFIANFFGKFITFESAQSSSCIKNFFRKLLLRDLLNSSQQLVVHGSASAVSERQLPEARWGALVDATQASPWASRGGGAAATASVQWQKRRRTEGDDNETHMWRSYADKQSRVKANIWCSSARALVVDGSTRMRKLYC